MNEQLVSVCGSEQKDPAGNTAALAIFLFAGHSSSFELKLHCSPLSVLRSKSVKFEKTTRNRTVVPPVKRGGEET